MNDNTRTFYMKIYDNDPEIIEEDEQMEQICEDIELIRETTESILDSIMAMYKDIHVLKNAIDTGNSTNPYFTKK